jgi:hypothetical protein
MSVISSKLGTRQVFEAYQVKKGHELEQVLVTPKASRKFGTMTLLSTLSMANEIHVR